MNGKKLITKLALIVAFGSLLFSIVTLIRAIIFNQGELLASMTVLGSAVVAAVCVFLDFAVRRDEQNAEDDEDNEDDEEEDDIADTAAQTAVEKDAAPAHEHRSTGRAQKKAARPAHAAGSHIRSDEPVSTAPEDDADRSVEDIEAQIDRLLKDLEKE